MVEDGNGERSIQQGTNDSLPEEPDTVMPQSDNLSSPQRLTSKEAGDKAQGFGSPDTTTTVAESLGSPQSHFTNDGDSDCGVRLVEHDSDIGDENGIPILHFVAGDIPHLGDLVSPSQATNSVASGSYAEYKISKILGLANEDSSLVVEQKSHCNDEHGIPILYFVAQGNIPHMGDIISPSQDTNTISSSSWHTNEPPGGDRRFSNEMISNGSHNGSGNVHYVEDSAGVIIERNGLGDPLEVPSSKNQPKQSDILSDIGRLFVTPGRGILFPQRSNSQLEVTEDDVNDVERLARTFEEYSASVEAQQSSSKTGPLTRAADDTVTAILQRDAARARKKQAKRELQAIQEEEFQKSVLRVFMNILMVLAAIIVAIGIALSVYKSFFK